MNMNESIRSIKTKGHTVYAHILPTKDVYFGRTKQQPYQRWVPRQYNGTFKKMIELYGWNNIEHIVIIDGLTYKQAKAVEGALIKQGRKDGFCINDRIGGNNDLKEYQRNWKKEHYERDKDKILARMKTPKYREKARLHDINRNQTPERKIYRRVCDYNRHHPDLKKETPLEAKQKYLQWGYIPDYIKSDDLFY